MLEVEPTCHRASVLRWFDLLIGCPIWVAKLTLSNRYLYQQELT